MRIIRLSLSILRVNSKNPTCALVNAITSAQYHYHDHYKIPLHFHAPKVIQVQSIIFHKPRHYTTTKQKTKEEKLCKLTYSNSSLSSAVSSSLKLRLLLILLPAVALRTVVRLRK